MQKHKWDCGGRIPLKIYHFDTSPLDNGSQVYHAHFPSPRSAPLSLGLVVNSRSQPITSQDY
jgi:hypothetical protein